MSAGAEYKALQDEMAAELLKITDPDTGLPVMGAVYRRDDIYKGEYLQGAPDLQAGFNDGYRVGWQDTMGGINRAVVDEQQPQVERRPLRDRGRDLGRRVLQQPEDRAREAAHHGHRAHGAEDARRAAARRTRTARRCGERPGVNASCSRCWR